MRRVLLCSLLSGLMIVLSSQCAHACINDREVNNAEREFKSQYQESPASDPSVPVSSPPSASDSLKEYGPLALGGALFVGAMVQVRRRSKTQQF